MKKLASFMLLLSLMACLGCEPQSTVDSDADSKKDGEPNSPVDPDELNFVESVEKADPRHGNHGGTKFEFSPSDISGEWLIDKKSDTVRFFILGVDGSNNVRVEADSFIVKNDEGMIFSLDPENSVNQQTASIFSLEDRSLVIAMNGAVAIELVANGKTYSANLAGNKAKN